jgi:arylsulfatase A-like enzyme
MRIPRPLLLAVLLALAPTGDAAPQTPTEPTSDAPAAAESAAPVAGAGTGPDDATSPPNILLLVADDLGWTDIRSGRGNHGLGSKYHETPNIDRLADQGMSFSAGYGHQSDAPARATLHSGQNPVRHWVYSRDGFQEGAPGLDQKERIAPPSGHRRDLPARLTSLPEALEPQGYRSTIIGKVRGFGPIQNLRAAHGFDVNLALSKQQRVPGKAQQRHYLAVQRGNGSWKFASPKFDRFAAPYTLQYVTRHLAPIANGNDPTLLVGTPKHLTDAIADAALERIADEAKRPGPFFIEVAFHAVHAAQGAAAPRKDLRAKYSARKSQDPAHRNPAYAGFVEGIDQSVGRIVAALDDPNGDGDNSDSIADQTLVVFVSDNGRVIGPKSGGPLRGGKNSFFEGGLRVPWIMRMPGTIAAGTSQDEPVALADLYPTFVELAGASLPPRKQQPLDGVSLVALMRGETQRLERPALFWHFPGYSGRYVTPLSVINRRHAGHRYKLTWSYEDERYRLYDLSVDRSEKHDLLAGTPPEEHRKTAERLSGDLRNWVMGLKAPRGWIRARNKPVKPPPLFSRPGRKP